MNWATFWTAVGGCSPVATGIVVYLRKFFTRVVVDANKPLEADVTSLKGDVAIIKAQFGPNGGGIRQAVNEIAIEVGVLKVSMADLKATQKAG